MNKPLSIRVESDKFPLSLFFCLIFVFYALSGDTRAEANTIKLVLFFIWIFIAALSRPKLFYYSISNYQTLALFIYLIYLGMTAIPNGGFDNASKLVGITLIYFSPLIVFKYYKNLNEQHLKTLLFFSLLCICYLIIRSLFLYSQDVNYARNLAADRQAYGDIAIGMGYQLGYALAIFSVYLVDILLNKLTFNLQRKILISILIFLMSYYVVSTRSTLTIIWLIIGFGLSLALRNRQSDIYEKSLKSIFIILIFILFLYNLEAIGRTIINISSFSNSIIIRRLSEVGHMLAYGESTFYIRLRLDLLLRSLVSFLESPLIGQGYKVGYDYSASLAFIGGHGEWVDILGGQGIIGFSLTFLIYFYSIIWERRLIGDKLPPNYVVVFLLLGIFNPLRNFQVNYVLMVLIPTISYFKAISVSRKQKTVLNEYSISEVQKNSDEVLFHAK